MHLFQLAYYDQRKQRLEAFWRMRPQLVTDRTSTTPLFLGFTVGVSSGRPWRCFPFCRCLGETTSRVLGRGLIILCRHLPTQVQVPGTEVLNLPQTVTLWHRLQGRRRGPVRGDQPESSVDESKAPSCRRRIALRWCRAFRIPSAHRETQGCMPLFHRSTQLRYIARMWGPATGVVYRFLAPHRWLSVLPAA